MPPAWVHVPSAILRSTKYRSTEKVLYALILAQHLAALDTLANQVSLRPTSIRRYLRTLRTDKLISSPDPKFFRPVPLDNQPTVPVNAEILQSPKWAVAERAIYMVLKDHGTEHISGRELARRTRLSPTTVNEALARLTNARLVKSMATGRYLVDDLAHAGKRAEELTRFKQTIEKNRPPRFRIVSKGERLMKAWLDTLVVPLPYVDNAPTFTAFRPSALELDRLYITSPPVACEFNGPCHYDEAYHETPDSFQLRQALDQEKKELCEAHGIALVTMTVGDLYRERIEALVKPHLPLRKWVLADQQRIIEEASLAYINWAADRVWHRRQP